MRDITDSIEARAGSTARQTERQMPVVIVVATVDEDVSAGEAKKVMRELMAAAEDDDLVEDAGADHTVDSFMAETFTAVRFEDAEEVRRWLRGQLQRRGYTADGFSIQAEIRDVRL